MSLKHKCVDTSLLLAHWPDGDGARDVGSAVFILCSRVDEHQSVRLQRGISLLRSFIMDDGSMLLIAGNGVE